MHRGYIKIWRKITEWEWWDDHLTFWFFIHLIFMANWEDKQWHGITIKRGQFVSSIENLRFQHGHGKRKKRLTTKQVRTLISRLKTTNELASESNSQFTLYTIVKYNDYQDINSTNTSEVASEVASEGQAKGKRRATTKELIRINKNVNKAFVPPTLLEVQTYCKDRSSVIDPELFFMTYDSQDWIKANGQPVKNWKSTLVTWEKREQDKYNVAKKENPHEI